jgi:alpha-glucosidase (family GH31 glycosyl hydrolase)
VATLSAPKEFIPLHIHGGNILPTQEPARNTETARNNPFGLIVALDVTANSDKLPKPNSDKITIVNRNGNSSI